ncbi:MAG: protein kinase [Planctomycetia bacterium]|nr:protein kinase [Planctomycetia bacterium]
MAASVCPSEQLLQAFQLGNLPERELDVVADHLERCGRCEHLAQQLDFAVDPIGAAIRLPAGAGWPETRLVQHPVTPPPLPSAGTDSFPFLKPAAAPDELGRLGNYRVLRLLGKGGMAFVFKAEDIALYRPVALKVMKPNLDRESFGWKRFLREARIMAAVKHTHLATIYQAGQDGDTAWLAMELLEGETLANRLDCLGPMTVPQVLRLGKELALGLAAIHAHGLVHRDLKPANIWLEDHYDRVKILDFGLARFLNDGANLTLPGTVMGTPAYMAPEQARGEPTDARSDLFSLGCVLYTACTGVKPFGAEHTMSVLNALAVEQPPPVHELAPAVPHPLSDLIARLLAKAPSDRPASAEALLELLRQIEIQFLDARVSHARAGKPVAPRDLQVAHSGWRWGTVGLAAIFGGLLGLVVWFWLLRGHDHTETPPPPGEAPPPGAVFLSTMPETDMVFWPFPAPLPDDLPPDPVGWPPPKGDRRIWIGGQPYPHGIFMHLPPFGNPKKCSVSYRLDGQYRTFQTRVSLNDGPLSCSPMTFTVYADGVMLWSSQPVRSQADTQSSGNLSVQGIGKLTLEVSGTGSERGSQAAWIEPFLLP